MDPFDQINDLNMQAFNEGFQEGETSGKKAAIIQGFQIGKKMSLSICKELGQIYGSMQAYKLNNTAHDEKCLKLADQICSLIDKFDFVNCHSDQFNFKLTHIRDKYKQFCSITNMKSYTNQINFTTTASKFNF